MVPVYFSSPAHLAFSRGSLAINIIFRYFCEQVTMHLRLNCQLHQSQLLSQLEHRRAAQQDASLVPTQRTTIVLQVSIIHGRRLSENIFNPDLFFTSLRLQHCSALSRGVQCLKGCDP